LISKFPSWKGIRSAVADKIKWQEAQESTLKD